MKRLTKRVNGKLTITEEFFTENDLINILAKRLEMYENADEDGRLIVIPCKPDIKVYTINLMDKFNTIKVSEDTVLRLTLERDGIIYIQTQQQSNGVLGVSVFLTQEEAELSLELRTSTIFSKYFI